jgi:putative addiction module component (TIGR02574 family)
MAVADLLREAKNLPTPERVALALAIWESLDEVTEIPEGDDPATRELARRRDAEMDAGKVTGHDHDEVIKAARQLLK